MYKKNRLRWLKHADFIFMDLLMMQLSLLISYGIFHETKQLASHNIVGITSIVIFLSQVLVIVFIESFKDVLKRGYWLEFTSMAKEEIMFAVTSIAVLYAMHDTGELSRLYIGFAFVFYTFLSYLGRIILKFYLKTKSSNNRGHRSTVVITESKLVPQVLAEFEKAEFQDIRITGLVLTDVSENQEDVNGIPVMKLDQDMVYNLSHEWVDEVFIYLDNMELLPETIEDELIRMGLTTHYCIATRASRGVRKVERFGTYTVMTSSTKMITTRQAFYKRLLDIIGGIVGCLFVLIFTIIIGPIIFIKDPGPIFFKQKRIGKNGKTFNMYKFRSMYKDAEERKKELMDQNKMDGLMFKVDNDPRIIKGIGNFIRNTSIDEFPQFINVLKGDMSLVGTRPPTLDEWEQYETKYRIRMSIKPGITGLWQTSGRSEITDFDEVVKLDAQYIRDWNMGLDLKLLLKTIVVIIKREGSQ